MDIHKWDFLNQTRDFGAHAAPVESLCRIFLIHDTPYRVVKKIDVVGYAHLCNAAVGYCASPIDTPHVQPIHGAIVVPALRSGTHDHRHG